MVTHLAFNNHYYKASKITRDKPKFEDIDADGDGCISEEEFQKLKRETKTTS